MVVNCELYINLICPDTRKSYDKTQAGVIYTESEVDDLGECQYMLDYNTAFACPYNCITEGNEDTFSVCSGNGLCVADPGIGIVRCICDEKYYGSSCNKEVQNTSSDIQQRSYVGFNVAIAIISILLIGFIIAVVYLYMRNKTLEKYAVHILDDS